MGDDNRADWPRFDGLEPTAAVEAAAWVVDGLASPGDASVGAMLPGGLEAYGRVLPPIQQAEGSGSRPRRWRDIAAERGMEFGPQIRFNDLVGWDIYRDGSSAPPTPYWPPSHGTLDEPECAVLASTLSQYTTRPDVCWFAFWEGYGWPELPPPGQGQPRVHTRNFDYLLFTGPILAATRFVSGPWFQSPTIWWPDDRAWCVATDVDGYRTYFGCSQAALDACQADWRLEVVQVDRDQFADISPYNEPPPSDG